MERAYITTYELPAPHNRPQALKRFQASRVLLRKLLQQAGDSLFPSGDDNNCSVVDVEIEELLGEATDGLAELPKVLALKVLRVKSEEWHGITEHLGVSAANGDWDLSGQSLHDEWGVKVTELSAHIQKTVAIAKPIHIHRLALK